MMFLLPLAPMQSHHLLSAAMSGDWDEVQKYLDAGKDINCSDTVGAPCSHCDSAFCLIMRDGWQRTKMQDGFVLEI
jgi:hypothetical protein